MSLTRTLPIAFSLFFSGLSHANWTPLVVGGTGSRSITTFGGAIYVATPPTGIRKSANDGASWTLANTGLPMNGSNVNVQSVGHSATALFCGTEQGVYRSTDNGASWVNVNGPLPGPSTSIYCNKIYTFGDATFLVYTGQVGTNGGGVFRTFDNGNTWLQAFSGLSVNMEVYNIDEFGGSLYAATSTALMKSNDLGASWQQVGNTNWRVRSVQGAYGALVILGDFGAQRSTNFGATWLPAMNDGAPSYGNPTIDNCPAGSELIAYDGKFFAITKSASQGVFRSLDNGATWAAYNDGFTPQNQFAQEEFHASPNHLYIACLFDSYRTPGTTTGLGETAQDVLPVPFPTVFEEYFNIDLSVIESDRTVVLVDASGREAARHGVSGGGLARIERATLVAGRYHCMLVDPNTGVMRSLGQLIAQ